MVAGQSGTPQHAERAQLWLQNWEVKNWFGEGSNEAFNLQSDDERLRCPSCVLKGYRITLSPLFVDERNIKREINEHTRREAEKKEKEQEERRKMQKMQEAADRVLAEKLAAADAKIRQRPARRNLKRKGDAIIEDANEAKRQKEGGDTRVSDMKEEQKGNLQPGWSHDILRCRCRDCSEEFFRRMNCDDWDYDWDYD